MKTQTSPARAHPSYTLEFAACGRDDERHRLDPPGALYRDASSGLIDRSSAAETSPEPNVNGTQLNWTLSSLTPGDVPAGRSWCTRRSGSASPRQPRRSEAAAAPSPSTSGDQHRNSSPVNATSLTQKRVYRLYRDTGRVPLLHRPGTATPYCA